MSDVNRWSPFRDLERVREEMDKFLDEFLSPKGKGRLAGSPRWRSMPSLRRDMTFSPSLDVYDQDNYLMVKVELPGVKKEDIHITAEDSWLKLTATTHRDEEVGDENYYRVERSYGTYTRTVDLPVPINADQVEAVYQDGVLTLRLPKAKVERAREIQIK